MNEPYIAPIGKQGTIEYRPNWGQPITPEGRWTGRTQPETTTLPDPAKLVQDNLDQLKTSFKQRADALRESGLDPEAHNRVLAGMQDEYDQAKAKSTGVRAQLGLIDQGTTSGAYSPQQAFQAKLRLVMPEGTVNELFPNVKPEPRGRFRPEDFGFTDYKDSFEESFARAAAAARPGEKYNLEVLKQEYSIWQENYGYNEFNTNQRHGYNAIWDGVAKELGVETEPQIKAARADTSVTRAAAGKLGVKPPSLARKAFGLTPLAKGITWMRNRRSPKTTPTEQMPQLEQMPQPKTKEEYDQLLPGTQYVGTDGQLRVKK
jgi:hypothetical protein